MRGAALLRAGAGIVELAGPERPPVARLWDRPVDDRMRLAARALAARNLVSAAVLASGSNRRVRVVITAVDSLHAASMIALAIASERYRRPALVSAAMATALALTTTG